MLTESWQVFCTKDDGRALNIFCGQDCCVMNSRMRSGFSLSVSSRVRYRIPVLSNFTLSHLLYFSPPPALMLPLKLKLPPCVYFNSSSRFQISALTTTFKNSGRTSLRFWEYIKEWVHPYISLWVGFKHKYCTLMSSTDWSCTRTFAVIQFPASNLVLFYNFISYSNTWHVMCSILFQTYDNHCTSGSYPINHQPSYCTVWILNSIQVN